MSAEDAAKGIGFFFGVILLAAVVAATFGVIAAFFWNDWGFNASELFNATDLTFWQAAVVGVFIFLIRLRGNKHVAQSNDSERHEEEQLPPSPPTPA